MTETFSVKYGTNIVEESVRKTLLEGNPEGVILRRKKVIGRRVYYTDRPVHIFYLGGNDKLKWWGFPIHECIDGFSQKIMWFVVCGC